MHAVSVVQLTHTDTMRSLDLQIKQMIVIAYELTIQISISPEVLLVTVLQILHCGSNHQGNKHVINIIILAITDID